MRNCPLCLNDKIEKERVVNNFDLLKCGNCRFVFSDVNRDENEKTNSGYDEKAIQAYESYQNKLDYKWMDRIVKKITSRSKRGKVLDVGCGNGLLLSIFKKHGWECFGVDLSPWSEKYAYEYGFKLFVGKIEDLELENSGYDLVTSTSTLEHIYDPVPHIKKIIKLVRPGGKGYISGVPNYDSLSIRFGFSTFNSNHPPGHANYFTPRTIRDAFEHSNEKIKEIRVGTYGIPELHRAKRFINGILKRSENSSKLHKEKKVFKKGGFGANFAVEMNYYFGKPFSIGDKIEVIFEK